MALSTAEIKRLIADDMSSPKKRMAAVGERYYNAEHDILDCRLFYYNADGKLVEDTTRSNIKISHAFFTELSDQLVYHLLSFKENPIRAKEKVDGLQDHLDRYFNAKFWTEVGDLIGGTYNKGFEYLYAYKKAATNRMAFECADSMGVVEVQAKDADDGQDHILYWYIDSIEKGKKTVKRIQDWTKDETFYYVQVGNGQIKSDDSVPYNPRPHIVFTDETGQKMGKSLGFIPFWRLDNNKKRTSGLKPIKGLIDDYDLHACSLSNNLKDFDTPLYVVSGFQGDNLDELQQNLKTKKIVGVDSEGGIDVKTVDIPYEARKAKLDIDERNIYRFGMGFNSSQVGDGNITNVVIQSRYTLLEMKAKKMQDRLCALLEEIVQVVLDEINQEHETDFQLSDVEFVFSRDTITNETENISNEKVKAETRQIVINTILNVAANIGDEQALKLICDELDLDYEELKDQAKKMKEEQDTADAKKLLEGVVTDEETEETVPSAAE